MRLDYPDKQEWQRIRPGARSCSTESTHPWRSEADYGTEGEFV